MALSFALFEPLMELALLASAAALCGTNAAYLGGRAKHTFYGMDEFFFAASAKPTGISTTLAATSRRLRSSWFVSLSAPGGSVQLHTYSAGEVARRPKSANQPV
jgi:hypothetical protein